MAAFYLDHNVSLHLVPILRADGHAVTTARDLGLEHVGDELHLLTAAEHGWTLITHNAKDFLLLHRAWVLWTRNWGVNASHAGILVVP